MNTVVLETHIPGLPALSRGKVRDIYGLGDRLLLIATDRISAFDVILPTGIEDKGAVLTGISRLWFELLGESVPHQLHGIDPLKIPVAIQEQWPSLARRSMIVRKAAPYPVECVARGYLSGSAWKEYRQNQRREMLVDGLVPCAGVLLPPGLVESDRLPEPVFTPATKATSGHDENISFAQMEAIVGPEIAAYLRDTTLRIYRQAVEYAAQRGIIIADTKLEFGEADGQAILIDEVLTPDSSRFWDAALYQPGKPQPSFDKQYVRDYLETLDWGKTYPGPALPPEVAAQTSARYREAYRRILGRELG